MSNFEDRTRPESEKIAENAADLHQGEHVGRLLGGRYRVTERGGKHDHVAAFVATDERGGATVEVRLLEDATAAVRERFEKAAAALAKVRHPCLAVLLDHGVLDGQTPYYVTERIDGDTAFALAQIDAIEPEDVVQIASGVTSGLAAAHKAGVLHGDIRPSNLVVVRRPDGGADTKVLDFGFAPELSVVKPLHKKTARGLGDTSPPERGFGSLPHASPEQIRGEAPTERSDVYVLGSVLYELLCGTPPFPRDAQAILSGGADPPSRRAPDRKIPAALDAPLLAALSLDPKDRPVSPAELGSLLWQALAEAKRGVRLGAAVPVIVASAAEGAGGKPDSKSAAASSTVATTVTTRRPASKKAASKEAVSKEAVSKEVISNGAVSNEPISKEAVSKEALSNEKAPPGEDDRPAGVPAKSRAPLLLMAAAVVLVFVAGWLFGRRSSGDAAQAQGQTTSATAAATASPPPATTSHAEPTATVDSTAPAAKSAAGVAAQARGARPEPDTTPARATTTTTSSPGYRVDDLKTPYR